MGVLESKETCVCDRETCAVGWKGGGRCMCVLEKQVEAGVRLGDAGRGDACMR